MKTEKKKTQVLSVLKTGMDGKRCYTVKTETIAPSSLEIIEASLDVDMWTQQFDKIFMEKLMISSIFIFWVRGGQLSRNQKRIRSFIAEYDAFLKCSRQFSIGKQKL